MEPKRLTTIAAACLEPAGRAPFVRLAEQRRRSLSGELRQLVRRELRDANMLDPLCGTGGTLLDAGAPAEREGA